MSTIPCRMGGRRTSYPTARGAGALTDFCPSACKSPKEVTSLVANGPQLGSPLIVTGETMGQGVTAPHV